MLAPIIDVAAIYALVVEPSARLLSVWLTFLILQLLSGAYAFRLDSERLRPLWSLPLQQFVYRQLMYLVVIQSAASAVYGTRLRRQPMRRTGEMTLPIALPQPAAAGTPAVSAGPTSRRIRPNAHSGRDN